MRFGPLFSGHSPWCELQLYARQQPTDRASERANERILQPGRTAFRRGGEAREMEIIWECHKGSGAEQTSRFAWLALKPAILTWTEGRGEERVPVRAGVSPGEDCMLRWCQTSGAWIRSCTSRHRGAGLVSDCDSVSKHDMKSATDHPLCARTAQLPAAAGHVEHLKKWVTWRLCSVKRQQPVQVTLCPELLFKKMSDRKRNRGAPMTLIP